MGTSDGLDAVGKKKNTLHLPDIDSGFVQSVANWSTDRAIATQQQCHQTDPSAVVTTRRPICHLTLKSLN